MRPGDLGFRGEGHMASDTERQTSKNVLLGQLHGALFGGKVAYPHLFITRL